MAMQQLLSFNTLNSWKWCIVWLTEEPEETIDMWPKGPYLILIIQTRCINGNRDNPLSGPLTFEPLPACLVDMEVG